MKVVLLNIFAPFEGSKCTSGLVYIEPLGLEYVGAAAKASGHDVRILAPHSFEDINAFAERTISEAPDVVGIGPETYNFNQAKAIAAIIRKKLRNVFVIFGSYHVTAVPEEVADPVIDVAIQGEGEHTFVEVLGCLQDHRSHYDLPGISYCKDGKVIVNPRRDRIQDLNSIPYPLRDPEDMKQYKCKGVFYPPQSQQKAVAQVAYSRGCPHACSYCASGNMWGRSVVYRDPNNVMDELQYLIDSFGTNLVFFSDLTFNLRKDKVLALCERMAKRNIKLNWFCGCRTEGIDDELLQAMRESGCTRIHYGIEAIDEYSTQKIQRQKTFQFIEDALMRTSDAGIITRAYLMIGYPWETRQHLETINANLNKLYIDDLRISFFTPFPGTAVNTEYLDHITTTNWDDYTTDKPVFAIEGMEMAEVLKLRDKIFLDYYRSDDYQSRVAEKIIKHPHLKGVFSEFLNEILGHD